jgi:hypothetical protein
MVMDLKGRRFDSLEDVIAASTRALNNIQMRISRDVSKSGNRDWISAYHPMESTVKATNEFFVIL